ncbi:fimbrial usher protein StbD [Klebsiella huaxiensis]|uniref:fimbrial usher protein StbD n=1 Tax=Klebsiella huaxiensis TaxID=2153354 RepID=UPI003165EBAC
MKYIHIFCGVLLSGLLSGPVFSACKKVTSANDLSQAAKDAGYIASSWGGTGDYDVTGKISLPAVITLSNGTGFQPDGTVLGSGTASFVPNGRTTGMTANRIMYRCDVSELGQIYEYYATNGDDNYGGHAEVSGMQDTYYTYVRRVGSRLTNLKTGEYYTRAWKRRSIPDSDVFNDGTYIYVPASAFSDVMLEVIRVDDRNIGNNAGRYQYAWPGPLGYLAFQGGGLSSGLYDGADSNSNYDGWGAAVWAGGWSLYRQTTIVRGATCRINDYPSVVRLPVAVVGELTAGGASQASFSINVECESGAKSSTSASTATSANVAMGFIVNNATAASKAASMGLVTPSGGYTWLLDNNYDASGVASGVGIRLYSNKLTGQPLNLLPDMSITGTGNDRGWYAFKDITELVSSGSTEFYSGDFTASLEAIPGEIVTAGSVYAQLQVVVNFQ